MKKGLLVFSAALLAAGLLFFGCDGGAGVASAPFVPQYAIGDIGPGGGIVFYVADGQDGRPLGFTVQGYGTPGEGLGFASYTAHYLEATPHESQGVWPHWSDEGTEVPGISTFSSDSDPLYTMIGNGRKDTLTIAAYLDDNDQEDMAAHRAIAVTHGGKNDWFLPSVGEFNLFYPQRLLPGIYYIDGNYWTSSQSGSLAWGWIHETNAMISNWAKHSYGQVRPIRAF